MGVLLGVVRRIDMRRIDITHAIWLAGEQPPSFTRVLTVASATVCITLLRNHRTSLKSQAQPVGALGNDAHTPVHGHSRVLPGDENTLHAMSTKL